jgi:hypothetical protein
VGDTVTLMVVGVFTVTIALAFLVVSAALVAVTVTPLLLLTVGAVNSPPLEIEPAVADHVTLVLLVPRTVAANCCVLPDATLVLVGETVTLMMSPEPEEILISVCSFAVAPWASVALIQKYLVMATLGTPNTAPVVPLSATPLGSAPSVRLNL